MSAPTSAVAAFSGLVELASEAMGGRTLGCTDDFFAEVENLLKPGRGVFIVDKYTDRGKWMDGWESRRRRGRSAGLFNEHDTAIIALGTPGVIRAFDIDTNHFLGNHPPYASVEAIKAPADATYEQLEAMSGWTEVLGQVALKAGSQNLFAADVTGDTYSHLRLRIYPDGGVARFRVYGIAEATWEAPDEPQAKDGEFDVAFIKHGGRAIACSDSFFSPMNNLISPGRAPNMGQGWESRRRRGVGHDWVIVELGARATIKMIEVDTNHFKGNYPDTLDVQGIDAAGAKITDLLSSDAWKPVLPTIHCKEDSREYFRNELVLTSPCTHVRMNVYPCGGVSRLRVYGIRS